MKAKIIVKRRKDIALNYNPAEHRVYADAIENFSRGETYRNTPDPLRTSLQRNYARFMVECFKREKRNSRSHGLRI